MDPEPNLDQLLAALPLHERVPAVALRNLLEQRSQLDVEQEMEIEKVRRKYADKLKPFLERASELIQGKNPKPEETAALPQYLKPGEKAGQLKGKVLDRYWNAAIENSQACQHVTEKDEKALEYLLDIQVVDPLEEDTHSINLRFIFKPNSYFSQTSVVRRLKFADGQPSCVEGDLLTWNQGQWLTHESKKVNNKATGESKLIQGKKIDSFFDVFLNWTTENPNELAKVDEIFNELLAVIRDSLSYFLGLFEMEGDLSEDDQSEEEDEEEEESPKSKKKK